MFTAGQQISDASHVAKIDAFHLMGDFAFNPVAEPSLAKPVDTFIRGAVASLSNLLDPASGQQKAFDMRDELEAHIRDLLSDNSPKYKEWLERASD